MAVRAKSVYEPAEPGDGLRVLTTNYWPRGVSKDRVGVYKRILGPARELLHAFKSGEIGWPEYRRQYLELMRGEEQRAEIEALAETARTQTVTIMCMCKDANECHRHLLQGLIEEAMTGARA
jgi:uncharacterized protein YeaO (DUF488 family)